MSTASSHSISPLHGPLRQTQPIHPQDTQLRVNYRPTPLPASHRFNNPYPHDAPMASSSGAGGSARWLSEDEGTGGTRLQHSSSPDSEARAEADAGGQSAGLMAAKNQWKVMSGTTGRRQRMRRTASTDPTLEGAQVANPSASTTRSGHPLAAAEGLPLPAIKSLTTTRMLPGGTSTFEASDAPTDSQAAEGSSSNAESTASRLVDSSASTSGGLSRTSTREGQVPDFAEGRGGDGIGGVGAPSDREAEEAALEERLQLLEKLRKIMGCPMCSQEDNGPCDLHQPITLHCGHTISASHVKLPRLPAPDVSGARNADEAQAIMQEHQTRKLAMWTSVRCPLPFCRQHRAGGEATPASERADPINQEGEDSAVNVQFYPSRLPLQPVDVEADAAVGAGPANTLLDVTVGKALYLVQRHLELAQALRTAVLRRGDTESIAQTAETESEADADEESGDDAAAPVEHHAGSASRPTTGTRAAQVAGQAAAATSPLSRQGSKRRRTSATSTVSSPSDSEQPPVSPRSRRHRERRQMGVPRTRPAAVHQLPQQPPANMGFEKELMGIVECDVCALLLYEPVTTPCQHTFCAKCLARSLDHSSRCPLCRQDLPSFAFFQNHAVNKVLMSIILTAFPGEYEDRRKAIEMDERDARLDTPLFICTLAFPNMPTILHVFEPRYRLMLRRCVESGNPRFGMVLPARGAGNPGIAGVLEYGTMLEIKSIQMLPDGRSMVETMGSYRFRVLEKGSLDGYTVGRTERIDDIPEEDEQALELLSIQRSRNANAARAAASGTAGSATPAAPIRPGNVRSLSTDALATSHQTNIPLESFPTHEPSTAELMATCQSFIEQLRSGSAPWLLQRLNNTYGPMPDTPSQFSYWMALVMPIDEYEKARLLPIRSPRLRLRLIVHWVEQLRSSWWFSSGLHRFASWYFNHLQDADEDDDVEDIDMPGLDRA